MTTQPQQFDAGMRRQRTNDPARIGRMTAAVFLWFVGVYTTWYTLTTLLGLPVPGRTDIDTRMFVSSSTFGLAIVLQLILSFLQMDWRQDSISRVALVVDMLVNASGIFLWMLNFDRTPAWQMLVQVFPELKAAYGAEMALVLSLVCGWFIARTPEKLIRRS